MNGFIVGFVCGVLAKIAFCSIVKNIHSKKQNKKYTIKPPNAMILDLQSNSPIGQPISINDARKKRGLNPLKGDLYNELL